MYIKYTAYRRLFFITFGALAALVCIVFGVSLFIGGNDNIKSTTVAVQGGDTKVPSSFTIDPSQKQMKYTSPTFKAHFEFNAIAPHWKEVNADDASRTVSVHTSTDNTQWSDWTPVEVMRPQRDNAPHADQVFPEAPLITLGIYFQYKVELTKVGTSVPYINDMSVTYIDSRPTLQQQLRMTLGTLLSSNVQADSLKPNVISRAAWGSPDPNGDTFKGTQNYWAPSYQATSQIFIHHTVDSNYTSQSDGPSLVRAIWQYHTYTLGWGDIGYNYLVDESGNVYEGRAHGDNVVAGQVYGYNSGSMGVALLGCFQPGNAACDQLNNGTTRAPSGAMLDSLTNLLAWKSTNYEIDPQAQHGFCKYDGSNCLNLYTISGHRDAYPTDCPGDLAYQDLQTIRNMTANKKAGQYSYAAKQVDYPWITLGDNDQQSVTLHFKNVGTATWNNSGPNPIDLATANSDDHASAFEGTGWIKNNRAATLNESSVAPGAIGSFTFNLGNPAGYTGDWMEYFRLVVEGSVNFGNFFGVPITTRNFSFSYNSQAAYTDSLKTTPLDLSKVSPGQSAWLTLSVTNTGNTTWHNSGPNPTVLGTDNPRDRDSAFCMAGWLTCNRPTGLKETSVPPGSVGTFEFPIQIPSGARNVNEYFTPLIEGIYWMSNPFISYPATIYGNYSWTWAGQQVYTDISKTSQVDLTDLSPGQTVFFTVSAQNNGNTTWYNSGSYAVSLGTSHPQNRTSAFYNQAWQSMNRPARLKEATVTPGQTGTFESTYTMPAVTGPFKEYLQPVADNASWFNDLGLTLSGTINGDYSWAWAGQQAYTDSSASTPVDLAHLSPGQRFYFIVSARNNGNTTWYRDGPYPIRLGTSHLQDRASQLYDSSWLSQNRSSSLTEVSVAPGTIGHFGAYYVAPAQAGTHQEYFQPVADNVSWLNDLGLTITLHVQ